MRKLTLNSYQMYSNQFQQLQVAYNNMKSVEAARVMTDCLKQFNDYMKQPEVANLAEQL